MNSNGNYPIPLPQKFPQIYPIYDENTIVLDNSIKSREFFIKKPNFSIRQQERAWWSLKIKGGIFQRSCLSHN
jgi:hypothetical protein